MGTEWWEVCTLLTVLVRVLPGAAPPTRERIVLHIVWLALEQIKIQNSKGDFY